MRGTIVRVGAGRRGINRLTTAFTTRGPIYLTIRLRQVGIDRLCPVGNHEALEVIGDQPLNQRAAIGAEHRGMDAKTLRAIGGNVQRELLLGFRLWL